MIFEIHITGEKSILEEFDRMNIKNITINLLGPNYNVVSTEYMSSFTNHNNSYEECKEYVDKLTSIISSKIFRVKIECPVYPEYIDRSIYIESHFEPRNSLYTPLNCPLSQNVKSGRTIATDRIYDKKFFGSFYENYKDIAECELCLFDDNIQQDFEWFKLYK